jgi:hypothetical protein
MAAKRNMASADVSQPLFPWRSPLKRSSWSRVPDMWKRKQKLVFSDRRLFLYCHLPGKHFLGTSREFGIFCGIWNLYLFIYFTICRKTPVGVLRKPRVPQNTMVGKHCPLPSYGSFLDPAERMALPYLNRTTCAIWIQLCHALCKIAFTLLSRV